ncbi:MAG: hypothetical protein ACRDJB_00990 [Actinomycetota bacterium]
MSDRAELEQLSTHELHDRAMSHARRHLDVGFLWHLIKSVPVAEAAAGHKGESEADVVSLTSLITDVFHSDEPEVAEQLRPLYIDYLAEHA